ncbi:15536_t:CDS:2 [Entrophospora sp. SA101]|nr:15536_t:CDS:2 [Entrophospora sp. SA101]
MFLGKSASATTFLLGLRLHLLQPPGLFGSFSNYPDKKTERIYLNQPLEGVLDCSEYEELEKIYISTSVDRSKLEIKGDQNYPREGTCIRGNEKKEESYQKGINNLSKIRSEITELDISEQYLEGKLNLNDFSNLKELKC